MLIKNSAIPLEGGVYELPKDEANLYNNLARLQNKQENHTQAIKSAQKALQLYGLLPDEYSGKQHGQRTSLDILGQTYFYLDDLQKAQTTLNQALEIARKIGDKAGEAQTLNHLGQTYQKLEHFESSLEMYNAALTLYQQVGDKTGEGKTLTHLGKTWLASGKAENAIAPLQKAITIWESLRPGLTDENKVS